MKLEIKGSINDGSTFSLAYFRTVIGLDIRLIDDDGQIVLEVTYPPLPSSTDQEDALSPATPL